MPDPLENAANIADTGALLLRNAEAQLDMAIPKGKIFVFRGDDKTLEPTRTATRGGVAVSITGATIWFSVKAENSDAEPALLVCKTGGDGITILTQSGATLGQYDVTIAATKTDGLTPGNYAYDIQIKEAGGQISTVEHGTFVIRRDYTRPTV